MKKTYSVEQKQTILNRYLSGTSVKEIVSETGIPRSTIYAWVKEGNLTEKDSTVNRKAYNQLQEHARRLEEMLDILKPAAVCLMTRCPKS